MFVAALLDLPVEGSLDDPEFHFGKLITKTMVNVLTKIVTSPFAALGAIFGGKGEELSFLDFAPGSAELEPATVEKLDVLSKGLYERPGLEVEIEGSTDPSSSKSRITISANWPRAALNACRIICSRAAKWRANGLFQWKPHKAKERPRPAAFSST